MEASSHDRIKMTKFWLEYDQKVFTRTNIFFVCLFNFAYCGLYTLQIPTNIENTTYNSYIFVSSFMNGP